MMKTANTSRFLFSPTHCGRKSSCGVYTLSHGTPRVRADWAHPSSLKPAGNPSTETVVFGKPYRVGPKTSNIFPFVRRRWRGSTAT